MQSNLLEYDDRENILQKMDQIHRDVDIVFGASALADLPGTTKPSQQSRRILNSLLLQNVTCAANLLCCSMLLVCPVLQHLMEKHCSFVLTSGLRITNINCYIPVDSKWRMLVY
ncbi:hypothetical protein AV530_017328 [Patagioenas fasciata monilis]|uniref:Uncharacterized protein n=1 Tax=Patagioenas fasciata monilis TaxID=372326 RepID=A0A1V4JFU1_PATFA|nr:hypothetical protein AV530_017328 [Patagioenas fasciata monilis]